MNSGVSDIRLSWSNSTITL